ncbi:MAG: hypothetical protein ACM3PD_07485, partial [Chloroflexota bacterium]
MSAPVGPGRILIDVVLDDRGRVASVTLDSSRPAGMARLFIGRPAQDVPALASQLFSICGFSHGVASQLAIAAARGEKPQDRQVFSFVIGLAAERLSESLRASALGWPRRRGKSEAVSRVATPLCEAMESARLLIAAARRGDAWKCRAALARAAERIADAATRFGLQTAAPHAPEPGSVFAAMMGEAQMDAAFRTCDPDVITSADDPVIAAALRDRGA